MSAGLKTSPKVIYLLFDISNGDYPAKNYAWWFSSYREAVAHRNRQNSNPTNARLVGPVKYTAAMRHQLAAADGEEP